MSEGTHQGGGHRDARTGTIFWDSPFRHMNMYRLGFQVFLFDTKLLRMGFDIAEREGSRLFHHIAEVAGERERRGLAWRERCLYEQDLATHLRPC